MPGGAWQGIFWRGFRLRPVDAVGLIPKSPHIEITAGVRTSEVAVEYSPYHGRGKTAIESLSSVTLCYYY
jgi:hypothetical protein